MLKLARRARRHFVILIEIHVHLIRGIFLYISVKKSEERNIIAQLKTKRENGSVEINL